MAKYESKSFNLVLIQIIGPALIMVMVATLVFFLIEVFYRGPHAGRLYWVMSFFTFASVLISRVSIEEGKERAWLLGVLLAGATFVTCSSLVEFKYAGLNFLSPLVTIGLIAIVMWSSAKLTWDCTVVDSSRDPSATGLVDLVQSSVRDELETAQESDKTSLLKRWLTGNPSKNNPGLWVFYFAMFAFPIFGFGQWFVETADRSWTFVLFAFYLGATLCLLMTTSLLGLQRYLSKRKLQVPNAIARNWIITGGTFASLVMLVVIFIPKPPTAGWSNDLAAILKSPDRDGWKHAPGKDGQKNDPDAVKKKADPNAQGPPEAKGDGDNGGDQKSKEKGGGEKGKEKGKQGSKDGDKKQDGNKKPDDQFRKNKQQPGNENKQPQTKPQKNANKKNKADKQNQRKNNAAENQQPQKRQAQPPQQKSESSSNLNKLFDSLSGLIKGLVYLLGAIAAIVLIFMFKDQLLALFGKKKKPKPVEQVTEKIPQVQLPGFRNFRDPFKSGKARKMSPDELLQYTLSAFQAWTRDAGVRQGPDDTPSELASRVKTIDPKVAQYAKLLANIYGKVAFGGKNQIGRDELEPLVKLWQYMTAAPISHQVASA